MRDPLLRSERTQGFTADPDYWKGEMFAYVGSIQNLKDLKARYLCTQAATIHRGPVQGCLAQKKAPPPKTL